MKNKELASASKWRRMVVLCVLLFSAAANSSFFVLHSSLLKAQTVEKGIASYYKKSWTGRKTASGDRLHHDSLTCAHKKHRFGTLLKVWCPSTDRTVVVRVNDRGPYARGRIIDLSWGAARDLGILQRGIAKVEVTVFDPTKEELPQGFLPGDSLSSDSVVFDEIPLPEPLVPPLP